VAELPLYPILSGSCGVPGRRCATPHRSWPRRPSRSPRRRRRRPPPWTSSPPATAPSTRRRARTSWSAPRASRRAPS
jgi:hypothetical protein